MLKNKFVSQTIFNYAKENTFVDSITDTHTMEINASIYECINTNCNDKYVNTDNEILDERPTFTPGKIPMPVQEYSCNATVGGAWSDLCIQCHSCQHVINPFSNTSDPNYNHCITDFADAKAYYFKNEDGIPNMCALITDRTKGTNGWTYFIERGAVRGIDPSMVLADEPVKIQTHRSNRVKCRDELCNSFPYSEIPVPPQISPRTARSAPKSTEQCYTCAANSDEVGSDGVIPDCFMTPTAIGSCSAGKFDLEDQACEVYASEEWDLTMGLHETKQTIDRGCADGGAMVAAAEATARNIDAWACVGNNCNNALETDMPPYEDIVVDDNNRWAHPLSFEEAEQLCVHVPCIECLTCMHIYDANDTTPGDYACSSRTYRGSFLNPANPNLMLTNHCLTRTGLRENAVGLLKRFVIHGADASDFAEPVEPREYVGETTLTSTDDLCFSCASTGTCILMGGEGDVSCPGKVCREYVFNNMRRWAGCATPTETAEFNNGVRVITEQEQWMTCNTDKCNVVGGNMYHPVSKFKIIV